MNYSRQRDSILQYLRSTKSHPTADTIYQNILTENPNISLGTVYRNLTQLTKLGEIQKLTFFDGPDRFDAAADPHYHFVCTKCGSIFDLDLDLYSLSHINLLASHNFSGMVEGHMTYFYGVCQQCMEKEENKNSLKNQ
ncbi:MAG: transcriptional repressor [Eubacterium sp.]|nr:transcriptional repressor [Eubacterium sp.]